MRNKIIFSINLNCLFIMHGDEKVITAYFPNEDRVEYTTSYAKINVDVHKGARFKGIVKSYRTY